MTAAPRRGAGWRGTGITGQLTLAGLVLSALMVLLTGAMSYSLTLSLANRLVDERLQGLVSLTGQRIESHLQHAVSDVAELAGNPIIANALVDSQGRAAYLVPFLRGYRTSAESAAESAIELTLFTFQGKAIASNTETPRIARLDGPLLDRALDGLPVAVADAGGLRVAYPVIYGATGQAEGVLLGILPLVPVVRGALPRFDHPFQVTLRKAGGTSLVSFGAAEASSLSASATLEVPALLHDLNLAVQVRIPVSTTDPLLSNLTVGYGVIGAVTALVMLVLVGIISRRLTRPLRSLSAEAARVAEDVTYRPRLVPERADEIGQLARTLDTMLGRLGEAHHVLEDRVAERTASLNEISSRLGVILDNVIDGIVTTDEAGRIVSVNRAAERIFGWPAGAMAGIGAGALVTGAPPSFPDAAGSDSARTWRQLEGRRQDGSTFPLEMAVSRVAVGDGALFIAVVRDITDRKRTEEELRLAASVYVNTTQGILITDGDGTILSVNPAFSVITGYVPEDVIGQNPRLWKSGLHDADFYAEIWRTLKDTGRWRGEVWNRRKSGELFLEWQTISVIHKDDGQPDWYVSIFDDITQRFEAQRALQERNVQLEEARRAADAASEAKSRFLATMSHELRTPMTGILGMTDLLLGSRLPLESKRFVVTLRQSADTLLLQLNDLLDFSKIEAGQLCLEQVDYRPRRLVEEVVALLGVTASEKGIGLSADPGPLPAVVRGDPTRLRQILLNLVGNAVKFTEKGGVTVRAAPMAPAAADGVPRLRFEVADTGIGIPEDRHAHLFQPFTQADVTTTRRFGGTGLGLAISRHLVEAMGGQIGLRSAPGAGTTVWFDVPAEPGDAGAIEEEASDAAIPTLPGVDNPAPRSGLSLLLAEDNETNRLLITAVLERLGHDVVAVDNGRRAVEAVRDGRFDLVIMDMQMPEMDGPEATRAIRALTAPRNAVPVVALTADALADARERYLGAGLDDFLTKPVDWRQLARVIQRHTPEDRSAGGDEAPALPRDSGADPLDTLPPFSREALEATLDGIGPTQIRGILQTLIDRFEIPLIAAEQAVVAGDGAGARRALHSLRGMAAQFGALRAEAICASLEGEEGNERVGVLLPALRDAVIQAREAVKDWIGRLESEGTP